MWAEPGGSSSTPSSTSRDSSAASARPTCTPVSRRSCWRCTPRPGYSTRSIIWCSRRYAAHCGSRPPAESDGIVRRAFVVVIDACGAGALPDAAEYGDAGANTLGHLAEQAGGLTLPCLAQLGLGSVLELQ